jgi:aryl carrier-like protein
MKTTRRVISSKDLHQLASVETLAAWKEDLDARLRGLT